MEELFQLLNSIKELSPELKDYLLQHLKERKLKEKEILLKAGHICRSIYFIEKGLFRCYYIDDKDEMCTWFMKESDVIVSITSFFKQEPSYEYIQALEDAVVHSITYDELYYAYRHFDEFNFIGRELLTKYYLLSEQRLSCLRCGTGPEKVEFLKRHYPHLVGRVEDQHLATFLDMTSHYYSRLKPKEEKRKQRPRGNKISNKRK